MNIAFEERLVLALHDAQEAFWAEIAKAFPEAKTGDFAPDAAFKFDNAIEQAVNVWLESNILKDDYSEDEIPPKDIRVGSVVSTTHDLTVGSVYGKNIYLPKASTGTVIEMDDACCIVEFEDVFPQVVIRSIPIAHLNVVAPPRPPEDQQWKPVPEKTFKVGDAVTINTDITLDVVYGLPIKLPKGSVGTVMRVDGTWVTVRFERAFPQAVIRDLEVYYLDKVAPSA